MVTDPILTFQAPGREGARVTCTASPVMELLYAYFYLDKRVTDDDKRGTDVVWPSQFRSEHPELVRALRGFGRDHGLDQVSLVPILLAARYGFERDRDPERFLREFPGLPQRFLRDGWAPDASGEAQSGPEGIETMQAAIAGLAEHDLAAPLRDLLDHLWKALGPSWLRDGRPAVERAVDEFRVAFERTGSVLESLPAHHFTRFEHLAAGIADAQARARVVVIPLYLAATGGFNFLIDDVHYVGYGLQSESAFERTAVRVASLAQRSKALADPTRLMVLAMVGRFGGMQPSVGDLAEQIGVSQPTVSGHLKLLRDAGLVVVEKRGNKAYYTLDEPALRQLLEDVEATLLT